MYVLSCDDALNHIFTLLDGELSATEQERLDAHLKQCPGCRREQERYLEQHSRLEQTFAVDAVTVAEFKQQLRTRIFVPAKVPNSRLTVLVVDDKVYILDLITRILQGSEFDVLRASDAEGAREQFSLHGIDIILSDQRMPGDTGVQLVEWVKENYPRTIRLLMTAYHLEDVQEAIAAINRGNIYHYMTKPFGSPDNVLLMLRQAAEKFRLERRQEQLVEELRQVNVDLERRVLMRTKALEAVNQDLLRKNKILTRLALTDPLTGLPNRRAIVQLAEQELRRRTRYPSSVGVGIIDIDHFKDVNTKLLLPGGDKVLTDMARCLQDSLRNVDLVGRIGGEEFLVIAPETDFDGIERLGERIRGVVERYPFSYKEKSIQLTVSLGFVVADSAMAADFASMKEAAARALDDAKKNGRNRLELRRFQPAA
jgi:diguanylate cyclase